MTLHAARHRPGAPSSSAHSHGASDPVAVVAMAPAPPRTAARGAVPAPARPNVAVTTARRVLPTAAAVALTLGATASAVADAGGSPTLTRAAGNLTAVLGATPTSLAAARTVPPIQVVVRTDERRSIVELNAEAAAEETRERAEFQANRSERRRSVGREAVAAQEAAARKKAKAKKIAQAHRWVSPIKDPSLSSPFGFRWGRLHAGLDFSARVGTPLHAMSSGMVVKAEWAGGYGQTVEIKYWDGTVSYFAHLSEISVKVGQLVAPGTFVGKSGNTGNSTGPHLHLEVHPAGGDPVDPAAWFAKHRISLT